MPAAEPTVKADDTRARRGRRLQVDILTALVALLVVTVGVIAWANYHTSERGLRRLADALMDRVTDSVLAKTKDYLAPAAELAAFTSRANDGGRLDVLGDERLARDARAAVRAYRQISNFLVADGAGNFLMAQRLADGQVAMKRVQRGPEGVRTTLGVHGADDAVVRTEALDDDYDPRVRPWYRGAAATEKVVWSDVYVFHTDRKPGVTASRKVSAPDGSLAAVVGLDVELGSLAKFLETLPVGDTGKVFLLAQDGSVVACPGVTPAADRATTAPPEIAAAFAAWGAHGPGKFMVETGGVRYLASFAPFPADIGNRWLIGVLVPERELLGPLEDANRLTLLLAAVVLVVALVAALRLARGISRPIVDLTAEMRRITALDFAPGAPVETHIHEIQEMTRAVASMKGALAAFMKYVPSGLVRQLIQTGAEAKLGGARRELTLFFSDIAGFTTISERLPAEEVMRHVSDYLDEMTRLVMAEGGTVDKYIGDAVMAFWGAPLPIEDHPVRACRAALACARRVEALNARWAAEGKPALPTRIGLATGEVVVGNLGSHERLNYTAVGDTVNLAARLEGANKRYGTTILVAEETARRVAGAFWLRPVDVVAVKGKDRAIRVHELLGERGEAGLEALATASAEAFERCVARQWAQARAALEKVEGLRPGDAWALQLRRRIEELEAEPPPAEWDGVRRLAEK